MFQFVDRNIKVFKEIEREGCMKRGGGVERKTGDGQKERTQ